MTTKEIQRKLESKFPGINFDVKKTKPGISIRVDDYCATEYPKGYPKKRVDAFLKKIGFDKE